MSPIFKCMDDSLGQTDGHMILRCLEIATSRVNLAVLPVKANYLRVPFTANYDARFVDFMSWLSMMANL